jgi:hypothetical protein
VRKPLNTTLSRAISTSLALRQEQQRRCEDLGDSPHGESNGCLDDFGMQDASAYSKGYSGPQILFPCSISRGARVGQVAATISAAIDIGTDNCDGVTPSINQVLGWICISPISPALPTVCGLPLLSVWMIAAHDRVHRRLLGFTAR